MSKKVKINIPGFGERYGSSNTEYKLYDNAYSYAFYKKGTKIYHNEYGPAAEYQDGSYRYIINHRYHRLSDLAYYFAYAKYAKYYVIGKFIGYTKEDFIKNLANTLIPNERYFL